MFRPSDSADSCLAASSPQNTPNRATRRLSVCGSFAAAMGIIFTASGFLYFVRMHSLLSRSLH